MKSSLRTGLSFGMTSGVITTLGLMVGLHSGTGSKLVVIGGIITIAIADAFSDALGIHISEEAKNNKEDHIWESTIVTFFSKFFFALTFIIPALLLSLNTAIIISVFWGLTVLTVLSYYIAKERRSNPVKVISEHIVIALVVIFLTHYIGDLVAAWFK